MATAVTGEPLVAIVEDDSFMRDLLEYGLSAAFCVRGFATAEHLLSAMTAGDLRPQILLTDLDLGAGLSGEALARLAHGWESPPIVVLMSGNPHRLADAMPLAMVTISKTPPFDIARIASIMKGLLTVAARPISNQRTR
jgi:DNA-binding NtrC family response regulator